MSEDDPIPFDLPDGYEPDWAALEEADDEAVFVEVGVELLKGAVSYALAAAGIVTENPHGRDDAIRCALLVRAGKLGRSMLIDTCVAGGEQQMGLSRQVMETVANLNYLTEDEEGIRHAAFVGDSLVAEREFLADIVRRQASAGDEWPIEVRIERSIQRTARAAGVDLSQLPKRSEIRWPSAVERMKQLGPTSYPAFRMGSGALHGSWHDLLTNHLEEVEGGFRARFELGLPRPQPLFVTALLLVDATSVYLSRRPAHEGHEFHDRLKSFRSRLARVDTLHESYLRR